MKLTLRLTILIFLVASTLKAQNVSNIKAVFIDDKVIVTYDLIASNTEQKFDVDLYSSVNNFSTPLKNVSGDVGKGLEAGKGKQIEVDIISELGQFDGDITFEVRAGVIMTTSSSISSSSVEFLNPINGSKFKRGKFYQVRWVGAKDSQIKLELYKNNSKISDMGNSPSGKDYGWVLPTDLKPGDDYQIKLSSNADNNIALSKTFKITRKVPLGLKIAPVLLVGGLAAALLGGGGSSGPDGPTEPNSLPAPPTPGN